MSGYQKFVSELYQYRGVSPCPDDIDAFWDMSISQMEQIDPEIELIPSPDFQPQGVECFDLYFTGMGNARIHAKYCRPRHIQKPCPAVLQFHGYGYPIYNWTDFFMYAQAGFCIAVMDVRGQHGYSQDPIPTQGISLVEHFTRGLTEDPENLYFRNVYLDAAKLARIVMSFPEVDEKRVGAFGSSQGGALSVACACLTPRINRIAPSVTALCDFKGTYDAQVANRHRTEIRELFRWYDPLHQREDIFFEKLGYIDLQNLVHRIRAKVYWCCCLEDVDCLPQSQFAAYNKITAPKQIDIYPDFQHEIPNGWPDKIFLFMEEMLK